MLTAKDYGRIRRAYRDGMSMLAIAEQLRAEGRAKHDVATYGRRLAIFVGKLPPAAPLGERAGISCRRMIFVHPYGFECTAIAR